MNLLTHCRVTLSRWRPGAHDAAYCTTVGKLVLVRPPVGLRSARQCGCISTDSCADIASLKQRSTAPVADLLHVTSRLRCKIERLERQRYPGSNVASFFIMLFQEAKMRTCRSTLPVASTHLIVSSAALIAAPSFP